MTIRMSYRMRVKTSFRAYKTPLPEDLSKNGWSWESLARQLANTSKISVNNAFDAEGLTKRRRKEAERRRA